MADYFNAVKGLQENLAVLNENGTQEQIALWNVSNALLTVCDALRELEVKVDQIQYQTKSRQ